MAVTSYKFGEFKLDCDRFELRRGDRSLKLERKPMELLILLAAKKGHLVTRAEIAERLWEQEVFVDTEHGINTAVRKIRQALKDDSDQPRFVQTVTGKGYRFIGVIEEESTIPLLPVAVEPPLPHADPAPARPLPWWLWVTLATSLAVALFFIPRLLSNRSGLGQIQSIAVLPLDNLSGDPGQNYVADGMTDELITMLAKNSTLRVTSRTSVMQYKGVHRPLPDIARELGVDSVLEGSIRRSGSDIHMTIQLIQASKDIHVWAESYDRNAQDLVSIPKQAAHAIAKKLNHLSPQPTLTRYVSPEAHDAYMRGRYLWFSDKTKESKAYFEKATELQPDYALGWSGLGIFYGASVVKGELSPADSFPGLEKAAAKAIELDDSLPEAHLAAASAALFVHWDYPRADAETLRTIELGPGFGEAYHLRAKFLLSQNRQAEGLEAQRKAMECDPFSRPWALVRALLQARQFDAALREANERLVAYPDNTIMLGLASQINEYMGRDRESVMLLSKVLTLQGNPADAASIQRLFTEHGATAVTRWKLDHLKQSAKTRYVSPVELAGLTLQLGDREGALKLLEEGYRQHATLLLWIQTDPVFDPLHGNERYRSIIRGMGLPTAF